MSIFEYLLNGFAVALTPNNLLFAFIGSLLGTLVGVLPGLGPTSGMAILLSVTTAVDPTAGIIMLAAIYYGAMYGGSITSILINIPGEAASVVTCLDGYQLAKQGKAGLALSMAAIASFIAGTVGLFGLVFFSPILADFALAFGPPEYFTLMVLSLTMITGLSGASMTKGFVMAAIGLLITAVGQDPMTALPRFNFGTVTLLAGINIVAVVIGVFGISEILENSEEPGMILFQKINKLYPTVKELYCSVGAILRSTVSGFFPGLLPGMTPSVVSFMAYDFERWLSSNRERFGKGAIEGVIAPEGANNAATSAGFIPLFSLGIPTTPPLAILLSGLMIYGLTPGPILFQQRPDFIWAVIASMYIGNAMLLILNLPLVGMWVRFIKIPYPYLAPGILAFCFIGTFSIRNNMFDVWTAFAAGVFGYFMRKLHFPLAPMVLGLVLGPILEQSFRQTMTSSGGSFAICLSRPIAAGFLILTLIVLIVFVLLKRKVTIPDESNS
jgi:putative tricarboxylic transport membrane protein